MAKEVKDAVVEEPVKVVEEPVDADGTEEELSPWYVFCSTGCGFCKKAEPVVEELNNEGYDILILDMAEPDNQALNKSYRQNIKLNVVHLGLLMLILVRVFVVIVKKMFY